MPMLQEASVQQLTNGPESFTPDMNWILGQSAEVYTFNQTYHRCLLNFFAHFCLISFLLDSLVVELRYRVREVPGSIPSQGPRHTKDVIKMVPVAPLFSTQH